ncbi:hypothetical protein [Kribbella sp. NPDC051718]|uniref:hypothetical protein n=1 Tax=Kribbella sp. NPDC051718 TaxID=3155168 RepID=UPI003425D127
MTKVTGLRAETSPTAAIATLSVAVAVAGHALAGGTVSLAVIPQLLALAAIAWSLGEHLAGRRWLTVGVLAAIQLSTHLALELGHRAPTSIGTATAASAAAPDGSALPTAMDHAAMGHSSMHDMAGMAGMAGMEMPASEPVASGVSAPATVHSGLAGVVSMSAAHLLVLLLGVALVTQAHRWVQRVVRILARLVPQLPAAPVALPGVRAALIGVPEVPRLTQRWLVSGVSRRGPPEYGVLAASY